MVNNKLNLSRFIVGTIMMLFALVSIGLGINSPFLCIASFIIAPISSYFFNKYVNLKRKQCFRSLTTLFVATFIFVGANLVSCQAPETNKNEIQENSVSEIQKDNVNETQKKNVVEEDLTATTEEEELIEAEVHFINTGNSDAILILQDGKTALIDAGDNDDESLMVDYLNNLEIKKIDYLVNTHPDADHCGGIDAVINNFNIGAFFVGNGSADSKTYADVITAAANKGINPSVPLEESKFELTSNSYIQFFNTKGGKDSNESSLVTLFVNGEDKFLLTGDAGEETENKILSKMQDVDVLKVGHHGSKNSTTQSFLDKVSPEYAVILTGKNEYGHPHSEVLTRLESANIKIHRSDECGDIIFKSSGQGVSTECAKGSYLANDKESREEAERVAEEQRVAAEKAEQERIEAEKAEQERIAAEEARLAQEAEAARQAEEAAAQQNNIGEMVWITATGSKYHRINNCGNTNPANARQIPLEEAQKNYQPCKKCY